MPWCDGFLPVVMFLLAVMSVVFQRRQEPLFLHDPASLALPAATSGTWRSLNLMGDWCLAVDNVSGQILRTPLESPSDGSRCRGGDGLVWAGRNQAIHGGSMIWYHRAVLMPSERQDGQCCTHAELSGWWRDGPHMQSNAEVLHFRGGALAVGERKKAAPVGRWAVFGAQQGFYNKLPRDAKAAGHDALGKKFREELNASEAWMLFRALYNLSHGNATSAKNADDGSNMTVVEQQKPVELLSTECYWFGEVASAGFHSVLDDSSATVNGTLYSTCGAVVEWSTTAREFLEFARALNTSVLVYCVVVVLLIGGIWHQRQFSVHSRTRMERISSWQLLVLFMWVSLALFFSEALLHASPLCKKAVNLLYALLMIAGAVCVYLHSVIEHELRREAPRNRARQSLIILAAVFCVQVLPLIFRTGMTKPFGLVVAAGTFWAPQLFLAFAGQGSKGLTVELIVAASLMPLSYFATLLVAPKSLMLPTADSTIPLLACSIVIVEAVVLLLARRFGAHRLIPLWLAPWRHRYLLRQPPALDEECSICKSALSEGNQGSFDVWLTPCRHYFHGPCLSMWMEQRMECPLCRARLPDL
jgi:uncharacterized membrane protein